MNILRLIAVVFIASCSLNGAFAISTTPDDNAKYLSGLQPAADSPLAPLTKQAAWQNHARFFDTTWKSLEKSQLSKVRAWSEKNLTRQQPTLFYMFSGPDFLYADAFFPKATTYILAGLEPVGPVPDVMALPSGSIPSELRNIEASLSTLMRYSFFITKDMRVKFASHKLTGTIPSLYVFLARSGKTIQDVSLIDLDKEGSVRPIGETGTASTANGVKIIFAGADAVQRTLYYFQTNVSNDGLRKSGFINFCEKMGTGDAFLKSASYLLHSGNFTSIRDFILKASTSILQDDSGITIRDFDRSKWEISPFGRYVGPIALFDRNYQPALEDIFRKARPTPLDFGLGYRIRAPETSVILAVKKSVQARNIADK